MARLIRRETMDDDFLTTWGDLILAYPILSTPVEESFAEAIEAAGDNDLYRLVAAHLGIDYLENIPLQLAALALQDAIEYAGKEGYWYALRNKDRKGFDSEDNLIARGRASRWATQCAKLAMACVDSRRQDSEDQQAVKDRTALAINTFYKWIYGHDDGAGHAEYDALTDRVEYDGASVLNVMRLLCFEFIRTCQRYGLIVDSATSVGPMVSRSNILASTRDLYLAMLHTEQDIAAAWQEEAQLYRPS